MDRQLPVLIALVGIAALLWSRRAAASINYDPNPIPDFVAGDDIYYGSDTMTSIANPTRGERNNNPGNIEKGPMWQGLAPTQSGDTRFAQFIAPEYGIRALGVLLRNYAAQGKNTIRKIINKYAPSSENNTLVYINAVSRDVGIGADDVIDLNDSYTLEHLIRAIVTHENGRLSYDDATIERAMTLIG